MSITRFASARQPYKVSDKDREFDRLSVLADDIEGVINDAKAHTLAGVAVKLRLMRQLALRTLRADWMDDDRNLDWQYQPGLSALRDLERLAGKGGAA
jgi:hypothetical protein